MAGPKSKKPAVSSRPVRHCSFLMWNILRSTNPQNLEPLTTTTFMTKTSQLCSAPKERHAQHNHNDRHNEHDQADRAEARAYEAQSKRYGILPHSAAGIAFKAAVSFATHFPSPRFSYVLLAVYTRGGKLVPNKFTRPSE